MPKFIIFSPSYNENIGGSIVLHCLCDLINRSGGDAFLYPMGGYTASANLFVKFRHMIYGLYLKIFKSKYKFCPGLLTPVSPKKIPDDAIIVYPEIVDGNPLKCNNVVRWLLYKPDYQTKKFGFKETDLIFYYIKAFCTQDFKHCGGELRVMQIHKEIYKKFNFGERHGTCYMLRKGKGRDLVHDANKSVLIDGFSHKEMAEIFNKSERFICYDLYTMYSMYAAMCGCVSIVVPMENITKEEWQPTERLRTGIAYGFDDIAWAKETMNQVHDVLQMEEDIGKKSVLNFMSVSKEYFYL